MLLLCESSWQDVTHYRHHCHCAADSGRGKLDAMTASTPRSHPPQPRQPRPAAQRNWLGRTASAVLSVLDEMNDAQRRVLRAQRAYDRFLPDPAAAPETYPEFLLRTSGPSSHEPTARQRAAGRRVR
jgi:hypothetical protein